MALLTSAVMYLRRSGVSCATLAIPRQPPLAEIAETVQIIPENVPAARRKTVIIHHAVERLNHVVQLSAVPAARIVGALQFVQFAISALQAAVAIPYVSLHFL